MDTGVIINVVFLTCMACMFGVFAYLDRGTRGTSEGYRFKSWIGMILFFIAFDLVVIITNWK